MTMIALCFVLKEKEKEKKRKEKVQKNHRKVGFLVVCPTGSL